MNQMSKKDKNYKLLLKDFQMMSAALLKCQREDGFWNPSLVSTNYAMKETSGTALFLYGMAWGIQKGYLKAKVYRPACDRAWTAMVHDAVHPDGFLGWMQGTGKDPSAGQPLSYTKIPDFEDYGTGCFLLGATEYYKLLKGVR
jgi:rhamnogalacturonyl hydrolase YesR